MMFVAFEEIDVCDMWWRYWCLWYVMTLLMFVTCDEAIEIRTLSINTNVYRII